MTPTQAAKEIGCSPALVRQLCRAGKVKYKIRQYPYGNSWWYDIPKSEVRRIKDNPSPSGWKRGRKRKEKK